MSDDDERAALYRCGVCNRRTWITTAGVVAQHRDSLGVHWCPLSGKSMEAVTLELIRAIYEHPSTPPPIPS